MSMTPRELSRLEKLEKFVERLTLGSYLAKAAASGGRVLGDRRVLEQGEQTLAKAAGAYTSAESLMALGEREITDATQMGVFASHLAYARDILIDTRERGRVAKAADAAQQVDTVLGDDDIAGFDAHRTMSEISGKFERRLAAVEDRLSQLEARPVAVPAPAPATVAKAAASKTSKTKARPPMTREEVAADLMRRIDAYIDSPTATGQLSSMVEAGEFDKVRAAVERAEVAHETEKVKSERRGFRR